MGKMQSQKHNRVHRNAKLFSKWFYPFLPTRSTMQVFQFRNVFPTVLSYRRSLILAFNFHFCNHLSDWASFIGWSNFLYVNYLLIPSFLLVIYFSFSYTFWILFLFLFWTLIGHLPFVYIEKCRLLCAILISPPLHWLLMEVSSFDRLIHFTNLFIWGLHFFVFCLIELYVYAGHKNIVL